MDKLGRMSEPLKDNLNSAAFRKFEQEKSINYIKKRWPMSKVLPLKRAKPTRNWRQRMVNCGRNFGG